MKLNRIDKLGSVRLVKFWSLLDLSQLIKYFKSLIVWFVIGYFKVKRQKINNNKSLLIKLTQPINNGDKVTLSH